MADQNESSKLTLVNREENEAEVRLTYVDSNGRKIEAIGCKFDRPCNVDPPQVTLVDKQETDAEVRSTYVDSNGENFEAVGCKISPPN